MSSDLCPYRVFKIYTHRVGFMKIIKSTLYNLHPSSYEYMPLARYMRYILVTFHLDYMWKKGRVDFD